MSAAGTDDANALFERVPLPQLGFRLLWQAIADIEPRMDLGEGPLGQRFMVPIKGGEFKGGPGIEGLDGEILPGGADRQLLRRDGVKELEAIYEMRTKAGIVLNIRNRVLVDDSRTPRYALSRIEVTAPLGPLDWLNRRLILGTLQPARPAREAVIIRAWEADAT
ncbi:DUF3237 domain-containing protein [uncultured Alsobacter sp.]|uniref:DUF3237 domain-containing protein n=1 Tax=uncultured Alsobacter sp. TaxID=1748258 RepID=UPI0025D6C425|nr:DUF3237 domain-containing protein [uncultured Alsobacter sp.]